MTNLFDDCALRDEELPAAVANRLQARRDGDAARKRRQRARDRQKLAPLQVVTNARVSVTPQLEFDLSRAEPDVSHDEITPEMALLVRAFHRLAVAGVPVEYESLKWALDEIMKADGVQIWNAARFLESAIERRAIPKFGGNQWATIPRAMLERLMRENRVREA